MASNKTRTISSTISNQSDINEKKQEQSNKQVLTKKELLSSSNNSDNSSLNNNNNNNNNNNENSDKPQKRLPPIKAPVGLAKGPDLKNCKSKVGSLNNIKHSPQSSGITIQSQKLKWNAKSKIGSLENKEHKPGGGNLKVETRKLEWKTTSKVQSLANVHHKPGGGNVKIFNETYVEKQTKINNDSKVSTKNDGELSTNQVAKDLKNLSLKD